MQFLNVFDSIFFGGFTVKVQTRSYIYIYLIIYNIYEYMILQCMREL